MTTFRLQQLKVTDYRCFPSLEIEFHEKLTVIVAANGAGKTAILDAVGIALGPFIGAFDESVGKHFHATDIRQTAIRSTASKEMEYAADGVGLEATGCFQFDGVRKVVGAEVVTWSRRLTGPVKTKTTIKEAKKLIDYGKRLQTAVRTPGTNVVLPLVAYYGTGRLWQQKKLTRGKLTRTSRTIGYRDCLDPASSFKSFVEWFAYWNDNISREHTAARKQGRDYEPTEFDGYVSSVIRAVNLCLAPAGWKNIDYSPASQELVAEHDEHGELPISLLSDGIRNMIGMIADIAFRATKLNGHLGTQAAEQTPGVVLIDEVDMHLHPSWQQTVLQSLTEAFPELQFIVTTHSPQVLSTVSRESIRVIECDDLGCRANPPDFSPLAHESGDALAKVMDTNPAPPLQLLEQVRMFEYLVREGKEFTEQGKQLRAKLEEAGYQHHESDLAAWRFLASHRSKDGIDHG
jgi:predicted ATP-binding protein involved in virulence